MAASLFEALELVEWLQAAVAGWRYLFSRAFRARTHERWRRANRWRVAWEVTCGLAGIGFTLLLIVLIVSLIAD